MHPLNCYLVCVMLDMVPLAGQSASCNSTLRLLTDGMASPSHSSLKIRGVVGCGNEIPRRAGTRAARTDPAQKMRRRRAADPRTEPAWMDSYAVHPPMRSTRVS
ncbi:hypothetical protein CLAIMM_12293 [Cladophialophora immunda]|nr:hypothetical protein CLAIMM_12293 [Cladophialophora immunda]